MVPYETLNPHVSTYIFLTFFNGFSTVKVVCLFGKRRVRNAAENAALLPRGGADSTRYDFHAAYDSRSKYVVDCTEQPPRI